jgi:hypothetical protein
LTDITEHKSMLIGRVVFGVSADGFTLEAANALDMDR